MPVIEVRGLTKRFGPVLAVDRLSFEVERGTVVGFLGPNGAGKTTTLRVLLGLVRPDEGTAAINGQAYLDLAEPLHQVGAVLEASGFRPGRTARNHLRIQALAGQADPSRIDDVLDIAGLTDVAGRRVGKFSLGMRQQLSLAAALLTDPELLILDEPASGLDPEGVRWLRDLPRGLADEGATVLVSSHILAEVAQTVDSVVILGHGRLAAQSTLAELAGAIIVFVEAIVLEPVLGGLFNSIQPYLPYTAATTLGGTALGRAAFGPANGASTTATPLPFAAATALLAALAVLLAVLAARTTARRDVG